MKEQENADANLRLGVCNGTQRYGAFKECSTIKLTQSFQLLQYSNGVSCKVILQYSSTSYYWECIHGEHLFRL
jgi:hypothetical protein